MTKVRLWFYLISGVLASVVPVLLAMGVITEGQGNSWMTAVGSIGSLIGAGGALTAGTMLNKQVKSGTVGSSPVEQVINNIPVVVKQAQDAAQNLDRVRQAATDALSSIIPVGPLAQQVIDEIGKALPKQ
jgi:hypothetical protein